MRNVYLVIIYLLSIMVFNSTIVFANEDVSESQLKFSILITAESSGSLEAVVVEGGSWLTPRKLVHTSVLVSHPKGDFLFDSGIGQEYEAQMSSFSFFEKQLFKIENVSPARSQLNQAQYSFTNLFAIIPSHMHWDHASGLEDFLGTPVWLLKESYDEAFSGKPPAFVLSQFDDPAIAWKFITLQQSSYEGFEKSLDIFNDGSAILVDLTGHTRGQFGLFLNLPSGQRYFFIGDTTWAKQGITHNKPRPKFVDWMVGVDTDFELNNMVIKKIHSLSLAKPELVIVPAHDELVVKSLPIFPMFSK